MTHATKTLRQWGGAAPCTTLERRRTALLLVDFQEEYFESGRLPLPDARKALGQAEALLAWARKEGLAVVHVQHVAASEQSPLFTPGSAQVALRPELAPLGSESVIRKALPSSFVGTSLHDGLSSRGVTTLVIAGLMTHMCVSSTARDALSLGYEVLVAGDACASRDLPAPFDRAPLSHALVHGAALAALADRFADVRPSGDLRRIPVRP